MQYVPKLAIFFSLRNDTPTLLQADNTTSSMYSLSLGPDNTNENRLLGKKQHNQWPTPSKKNPSFFQKFSPSRMKITFFVYSLFASDETFLPKCRDYSSSIHARWTAEEDSNTASQRDIITKEDKSQHSWSPWQRLPRHLHMLFIARSVSIISFLSEGRRVSNQKPEKIRNRIFRFVHDQM